MTFPGMRPPKTVVQGVSQPKLVERSTGQVYILVRDDTAVNGKLYIAPIGMMTSMRSIRPEVLKENFEWYVELKDRPVPVREVDATEMSSVPLTEEEVDAGVAAIFDTPEAVEAAVEAITDPPKKRGGRPKGSKDTKKRKRVKRKT